MKFASTIRTWLRENKRKRLLGKATRHRAAMKETTFIGITGSSGKTTATRLLHHILEAAGPATVSAFSNDAKSVANRLLAMPPSRHGVFEVSGDFPGAVAATCAVLQPDVGIILKVAGEHVSNLPSLDAVAREKGTLAEVIAADGLVLLNVDDPLVAAMKSRTRARVVTFGLSPQADYQASDVHLDAGGRLGFLLRHDGQTMPVSVPLAGRHFVTSTLAAIACAHQRGLPLPTIRERAQTFEPTFGRCSIQQAENGPLFICDCIKAPKHSLGLVVELAADMPAAPRKTIVFGTVSDASKGISSRYSPAIKDALEVCDRVVLTGEMATSVKVDPGLVASGRVVLAPTISELRDKVRADSLPGELIILKGSGKVDHMERIALDWTHNVNCWVDDCRRGNDGRGCFNCERVLPRA